MGPAIFGTLLTNPFDRLRGFLPDGISKHFFGNRGRAGTRAADPIGQATTIKTNAEQFGIISQFAPRNESKTKMQERKHMGKMKTENPDSITALLSKDYARYISGAMSEEERADYISTAENCAMQLRIRIRNTKNGFNNRPIYLLETGLEFSQPAGRLEWYLECIHVATMQPTNQFMPVKSDPDNGSVILLCRPDNKTAPLLEKLLTDANIKCSRMNPERMSAADYLAGGFYNNDIDFIQNYAGRKMGLHEDIDRYLTLYPGLAVLGGQASLGKTTFCINVVNKLLERGEHVLYFALEQRPEELITKILARYIFENNPETNINNLMLNAGDRSAETCAAIGAQADRLKNFHIIECSFETTAQWIIDQVTRYTDNNPNITPVVIVDYLQIIAAPPAFRGDKRATVDNNLKALKKMQKSKGLFVIVISSFNRSSNMEPVSYECFLETSCIEYTCDYVWGLQLAIQDTDNEEFYIKEGAQGGKKSREEYDKKRMMQEAQAQTPKKVQFVSLKNRRGRQFFKANFDYYPAHDFFTPDSSRTYGGPHPYNDIFSKLKGQGKKSLTAAELKKLNDIFEACQKEGRATLDEMTAHLGGSQFTRQSLERQFEIAADFDIVGGIVTRHFEI